MKLRYETGTATLIQFIVLSLLSIPNTLVSIISTCHSNGNDCATNSLGSVVLFMLTVVWFGIVWAMGFLAQDRRSRLLAWMLIGAELLTAAVALHFNLPHETDILSKATSVIDIVLAFWIILLAFRLSRAKGGRIVKSGRARNRQRPSPPVVKP